MAVNLPSLPPLLPIAGIKVGTTLAHIKQSKRDDLTLFELAPQSTCAAVFTRNAFCAAPVTIAREHLQASSPRFLLINSGNANAGTGERGIEDALTCCKAVAQLTGCSPVEVLPFSTGVIGMFLPIEKIRQALPSVLVALNANGWNKAAQAIMTTDTLPKGTSSSVIIEGKPVTVTGIAKGAGMIRPNLATMLAFIATDASVPPAILQACLQQVVAETFNCITIDGDTSTNDACVLVATGHRKVSIDSLQHPDYPLFYQAVQEVCLRLALMIVRDGEGATKFITILVEQGASKEECFEVAYAVAHSPLVKTAFFASDANWGRILAAVGRANVVNLEINQVQIYLGKICIVQHGGIAENYTEEQGKKVMDQAEITVRILLGGRGDYQATVYTCDFSYDYVRINAGYRT